MPTGFYSSVVAIVLMAAAGVTGLTAALAQTATPPAADGGCVTLPTQGEQYIVGRLNAPAGSVSIPELSLTTSIVNGCFGFRNLSLPQDPTLISFQFTAPGYRPTTLRNYLVIAAAAGGAALGFTLEQGTEPDVRDACPDLIAHPQTQSAAIQQHAALCAQLEGATLPTTGAGHVANERLPIAVLSLLAVAAFALVGALRLRARAEPECP